jgi:hypothetical protein
MISKEYECLTCHKPIKISKIDNPTSGQKKKLERFGLDELTPHQCVFKKNKEEATEETATTTTVLDRIHRNRLQHLQKK